VHVDVAHPDPRMVEKRDHEQERRELETVMVEEPLPQRVVDATGPQRDPEEERRIEHHHDGRETLDQPVREAVVRADRVPLGYHNRAPSISVSARLATSTTTLDRRAEG